MCKTCEKVKAGDIVFLAYDGHDVIMKVKNNKKSLTPNYYGHTIKLNGTFFYSSRNIVIKGEQHEIGYGIHAMKTIKILKRDAIEKDWNKMKTIYLLI